MAKQRPTPPIKNTKQSSDLQDSDEVLSSISGKHKLIQQHIDAQTASLKSQKVAYESIAAAQQKGVNVDKEAAEVKKRLNKEQKSLSESNKKIKDEFDAIGESLDHIGGSGVAGIGELTNVLKAAKKGGEGLSIALFALGAAAGGMAYNLGLVGDKLGTIAKYDKQIVPLQEKMDLLRNSIEGSFAGQEAAGRFGFEMQRMAVAFQTASKTALFGKGLGSVGYGAAQLQLAGISAENIASQMQAAGDATGKMPSSRIAADMAVMGARTGQSAENIAAINESFMRVDGLSASSALNMQEGMRAMADKAGINLGGLMTEMAESSKDMLGYQIKSSSALAKQVTFARSMGVSFQDIAKAGQSMVLNYKDSIKSEMQLSAMLGKNVDLSQVRSSFAAGDTEGALKALKAQGLDPGKMDMFQQQMLQQATGMDLTTLSKINKNTGKDVSLGAGNATAGNKGFLGAKQAAEVSQQIQNANIQVAESAFNISMDAKKKLAVLESEEMRAYQNQIAQLEAMKDAEVGLTTALISLASGLATSMLGKLLTGKISFGQMFGKEKYKQNAAGRYVDPKTNRYVSNKSVADARASGQMGMSRGAKIGGAALAAGAGAIQGYQNFSAVREGETETRTSDKVGAGFVQGGLAAAGTAIGAAFGGPVGMMIGGFLGDSIGGWLNENAPGVAQGVGDMFSGIMSTFSEVWTELKTAFGSLWNSIAPIREMFGSLAKQLGMGNNGFGGILKMVGKAIGYSLLWPLKLVTGVIGFVGKAINFLMETYNSVANSWLGKKLGLGAVKIEKPKPEAKKAATTTTKAPAQSVGNKSVATTTTKPQVMNATAGTVMSEAGSKSVTTAIANSSKTMMDKLVQMNGNMERVVARTQATMVNTANTTNQLKVLNTNTTALMNLTTKIEALTRATYEGSTVVKVDGKIIAKASNKYTENQQASNPTNKTGIIGAVTGR